VARIETLIRLIGEIHDAALDVTGWEVFLEDLADALDGHIVNLGYTAATGAALGMERVVRFDPVERRLYHEHFRTEDPWVGAAFRQGLFRTGVVALGREVVPPDEYERTAFHNEFGRRLGLRGGLSAVIDAGPQVVAALSASERPAGRVFGSEEVELVRRLLPHLQRALTVHERLNVLSSRQEAAESALDRLPFGVLLLDHLGRAVFVNRAAHLIVSGNDGLRLERNLLTASTGRPQRALRDAIARALAVSGGALVHPGGALRILRPSGRRAYEVVAAALPAGQPFVPRRRSRVVVFITDPENPRPDRGELLRQLYGLTPAETRLAAALANGSTMEQAAGALDISIHTARTHLKRLFEKTGTRRQSQLVRLISTGLHQLDARIFPPHPNG
jgi:DNA-binding CsgD family transcriptional regulator